MKDMRQRFFAALLACALCAGGAWAAEGDYVLKDGKVYRVDGGKEKLLEDEEPQRANTDAGFFAWVLVDPEFDGMEGSESGIYFFLGEDERPAGFLPIENAGACMLEFSPSGEKLLISHGVEAKQDLGYYVVNAAKKSFVRKKSFASMGPVAWVDPHRFIFTAIDEKKGRRPGSEDTWWYSAALYDTVEDDLIVVKEATETKNYMITGCDHEEGTLDVNEASVKDKKDWGDDNKINYKESTVPIPAAG